MIDQVVANCRKQLSTAHVTKACGLCLPVMAVVQACYINLSSKMPIPIEQPAILVFGALFVVAALKGEAAIILQKVTGFYLISVPVNQLSAQYFSLPFWMADISLSHSAVILALCAAGYFVGRVDTNGASDDVRTANMTHAWLFALALIVAHMVFLAPVLVKVYGYGYERNPSVLGNLALYFMLFLTLWRSLGRLRFRQCVGLMLAIFYLVATVGKYGPT
jgi:hypothetical protein